MASRIRQFVFSGLIVVISFSLLSCGGKKDFKPVNFAKGDKCDFCSATIQNAVNAAFASEIIDEGGKVYRFDDFRCLESFMKKQNSPHPGAVFVKDYETRAWIPYNQATIVLTSIATPMRSGKVAFKDSVHARAFAEKNRPL
jgi:copper chaperone NosL